jgi:hypothetical protein
MAEILIAEIPEVVEVILEEDNRVCFYKNSLFF